ncbi:MAG: TonB-dependent receptor family protein, partial [Bacteroidales bacterium]|nr:TonB-dependent receptor family protein [Candidatus Cryptobacteroides caccocaballi]
LIKNIYGNYNVKIGHDWFINDRNVVGAILYAPGEVQDMRSDKGLTRMWLGGVPVQDITTDIANRSRSRQYNANLNYTHVFDEKRSAEMTVNLDYYRNGAASSNVQNDESVMVDMPAERRLSTQSVDTDQTYDIYSAKADYQTVLLKRYMFEAGAKWALSVTNNNGIEKKTEMPDVLSDFLYREHVAAAYFNVAGQFGEKFSAKLGLRGEYTNSFGDWRSAGEKSRSSYFDLFPTAYLGFAASEKVRLSLSYTRRITRPNYNQLDPTKKYIDAQSYLVGNPALLPSYNQSVTLSSGFGQHLSLAVGYDYSTKLLIQSPDFDESGMESMTWANAGVQHMAYLAFSVSALPVTKWLDWTFSATGLYTDANLREIGRRNSSFGAQVYTDLTFNLPKEWKISMDAQLQTPMAYNIYRLRTQFQSNFSMRKTLLENKLILSFRVDDIFNTSNNNLKMLAPGDSDLYIGQKYYRCKAIVDLTWNFGQAQSTKARKVGNLDEMSRVGNNN